MRLDPGGRLLLFMGQSNLIFPLFSTVLPFIPGGVRLYYPILEWLQQGHCYSQGAGIPPLPPHCNSIHSQLDGPRWFIEKPSLSGETLTWYTLGILPLVYHDVLGIGSVHFEAAAIGRSGEKKKERCMVKSQIKRGYGHNLIFRWEISKSISHRSCLPSSGRIVGTIA